MSSSRANRRRQPTPPPSIDQIDPRLRRGAQASIFFPLNVSRLVQKKEEIQAFQTNLHIVIIFTKRYLRIFFSLPTQSNDCSTDGILQFHDRFVRPDSTIERTRFHLPSGGYFIRRFSASISRAAATDSGPRPANATTGNRAVTTSRDVITDQAKPSISKRLVPDFGR